MRFRPLTASVAVLVLLAAIAAGSTGCNPSRGSGDRLFTRLSPEATGVAFENRLDESVAFNIISYLYYYNGGGVAAGDVNGDGRPDLYFTANERPNKLYLNRTAPGGPVQFEDVTEAAGVAGTSDWTTGVTMADVDGDGHLDLYVSALGGVRTRRGRNELFLNEGTAPNGVPRFREAAAEVGLDFEGYGTQAAFFDYDRDGDLDVYLLNHAVHTERAYSSLASARRRDERSGDRLYRNDGEPGAARFIEVTEEAGITSGISGYGLSIVTSDIDGDGWPDLYVGNDFHENDFLYINNGDGTFREVIHEALRHTSRFSMGADAADINGDGRTDLVVLDMLPRREAIRKISGGEESREIAEIKENLGYLPQVARNVLHLNQGTAPDGTPRFSDVAPLAGIEATDWSWTALLADLDLDGRRDLFVTNGIWRRPNDLDFINYASNAAIQRDIEAGLSETNLDLFQRMPQVALPNEAFRNVGGVRFEEMSDTWGLADEGFSNGAVTVDLDNDGDLDLVVNNVNAPAWIYENQAADRGGRSLLITLRGDDANTAGVGAHVTVWTGDRTQTAELFPTRGFLSAVDPRLVFGLDGAAQAARVQVVWPDGREQTLTEVPAGPLTLRQSEAGPPREAAPRRAPVRLFTDVTATVGLDWEHRENPFEDFGREQLMPHMISTLGPALAVGDVNGDGLEDLFVGGAKLQPSALFLQTASGFTPAGPDPWQADSLAEAVAAAFFDADADGDLDLYVGMAGNEFWGQNDAIRDRFYLGDGAGGFAPAPAGALPDLFTHTGTVAPADFDGDGDTDLFIGGRVVPRAYGRPAQSALLLNDGQGRFRDATAEWAPALERIGMVSAAAWADLDGDSRPDLALTGEWMAPTLFRNTGQRLEQIEAGLADATGWWTALTAADFDGDGDTDLALGNLGLNSLIRASAEHPARLWLADFDENGALDGLLTTYRDGADYPFATVQTLQKQFPELRKRYPTATAFGARTPSDLFGDRARTADQLTASTFASMVALNDGAGGFTLRPLPDLAQVEPLYAFLADDVDGDGITDLLLGGGLLGVIPDRGRYDAGYGLLLRGNAGTLTWSDQPGERLLLHGEIRALRWLRRADGTRLLVAARNDAPLQFLRLETSPEPPAAP